MAGFACLELQRLILREPLGQQQPYPISIKLQRLPNPPLNEVLTLTNNITPNIRNHRCRLHRIPPRSLPHHIPIETIQNDLMGQLERLVQGHQGFTLFSVYVVSGFYVFLEVGFLDFYFCFEVVATVSEGTHCIDVETVLAHADGVFADFGFVDMCLFV